MAMRPSLPQQIFIHHLLKLGDFGDLRFSGFSVEFELDPVELEGCIGLICEGTSGVEFL